MKNLLQIIKTSFLAAPFTLFIQHVKAAEKPKVGDTAPTATLSDDNGNPLNLEKTFKQGTTLLFFIQKPTPVDERFKPAVCGIALRH